MALDVVEQKAKREKFSRRRRHDPDADIDYINERNMKFNQKCERYVPQIFTSSLGSFYQKSKGRNLT